MARIPNCDESLLTAHSELLSSIEQNFGFVPESFRTLAYKPALLSALGDLSAAVMGSDAITSKRLRWMVSYVSSAAAGCTYCSAHTAYNLAKVCDVEEDTIAELWTFEQSDRFTEAERAALRVAMAAGTSPGSVSEADVLELTDHFSPVEVVELVAAMSLFGFLNRWNATLATSLEAGPADFARRLNSQVAPSLDRPPLPPQCSSGGGLLFVSGQLAFDDALELVGPRDPYVQARTCFGNVERVLAEQQASLDDVVRVTCYLVDATHYADYAKAKAEAMPGQSPASTTVVVKELLLPDALVEVEVVAVQPPVSEEVPS